MSRRTPDGPREHGLPRRLRVPVTSLDEDGDGVALVDGRPVAVPGTLPGELVEITPPLAGRGQARLARVVRPAPERVQPLCAHALECGGCSWQHVAYAEQLRLKRERVQFLLDTELGRGCVHVASTIPTPVDAGTGGSAPWRFRHKVHFAFDTGPDGRVVMGHLARGSHRVVDIRECPVHVDAGNALARRVKDVLSTSGVACGPPPRGLVRHLVARVGRAGGEVLATLVVTRREEAVERASRAVLDGVEAPVGWSVNVHPRPSAMLFGHETHHVAGKERISEQVGGATFLMSATSFFQTNLAAADTLLDLVLGAMPAPSVRVLDLYAGLGLFAIPLAIRGHEVLAVEENPVAVADGVESARVNDLGPERCRFIRSKVEYAIGRLKNRRPRFDVVVLDPPRSGAPPAVLRRVRDDLRPGRVVYVSCDPESFARDLRELLNGRTGPPYRLARVVPVDMFPHTTHVEAVAVLDPA